MNNLELLRAIDGQGQLWSDDGQFLGMLSSNQHDAKSICNSHSIYGAACSFESIRNKSGMYGSVCGIYSAYDPQASRPPAIVHEGCVVGFVTKNHHLFTNGVPIIDPDLLLSIC